MARRIKEILENVVYAGMKPKGGATTQPERVTWFTPIRAWIGRFVSGGPAPDDPLYLSNRTLGQKFRLALVIAVPCLLLGAPVAIGLSNYYTAKTKPARDLTPAEFAARFLPDLKNDITLPSNKDVEVQDAHIIQEGSRLAGMVKNNTDHAIHAADIVFSLTNSQGSQLGRVSTTVQDVPPQSTVNFEIPIAQQEAAFALVMKITTQ